MFQFPGLLPASRLLLTARTQSLSPGWPPSSPTVRSFTTTSTWGRWSTGERRARGASRCLVVWGPTEWRDWGRAYSTSSGWRPPPGGVRGGAPRWWARLHPPGTGLRSRILAVRSSSAGGLRFTSAALTPAPAPLTPGGSSRARRPPGSTRHRSTAAASSRSTRRPPRTPGTTPVSSRTPSW